MATDDSCVLTVFLGESPLGTGDKCLVKLYDALRAKAVATGKVTGLPQPVKYEGGRPGIRWQLAAYGVSRDEIQQMADEAGVNVKSEVHYDKYEIDFEEIKVKPEQCNDAHELHISYARSGDRWYVEACPNRRG